MESASLPALASSIAFSSELSTAAALKTSLSISQAPALADELLTQKYLLRNLACGHWKQRRDFRHCRLAPILRNAVHLAIGNA